MEADFQTYEPLVERRQFPRLSFHSPVQFRNVLKPQEPFSGSLSKDLSAGGLSITTDQFLPRDTRLVLLVSLPILLKPVRTIGRILWIKQRFGETYDCGVQFLEMNTEDRDAIAAYVERGIMNPQARLQDQTD